MSSGVDTKDLDTTQQTSYNLITDELVETALRNDIGDGAKLSSWEVKDFTKPGDNYSCIVTSVLAKYVKDGELADTSLVAKLNPLREKSAFSEMMDTMYSKEAVVLSDIICGMNEELSKLKLPPIKSPKLLAVNFEKRKEMLMATDLRRQGFKMYDRKKGLDVAHALLVVEELGRFHACSLLFEETLPSKNIPDSFDYFEEKWLNVKAPSFKMFDAMVKGQIANSINLLNNLPEYSKCLSWLQNFLERSGETFLKYFDSCKPFQVLCHGDCWTNNFLFKYNDSGIPIDMRFVDFQGARTASPGNDLNYLFYASLRGDTRREHMKLLLVTYYLSFSKIILLAGQETPFTFQEFKTEVENRRIFGLISGMFLLPIILAEDKLFDIGNMHEDKISELTEHLQEQFEGVAKRGENFKDRFLAMFDEMLEAGIFDQEL